MAFYSPILLYLYLPLPGLERCYHFHPDLTIRMLVVTALLVLLPLFPQPVYPLRISVQLAMLRLPESRPIPLIQAVLGRQLPWARPAWCSTLVVNVRQAFNINNNYNNNSNNNHHHTSARCRWSRIF